MKDREIIEEVMKLEQIHTKVYRIISIVSNISTKEIRKESHLYYDLNLKSEDLEDIILRLEEQFNIFIDNEKIQEFNNIDQLLEYVVELVQE